MQWISGIAAVLLILLVAVFASGQYEAGQAEKCATEIKVRECLAEKSCKPKRPCPDKKGAEQEQRNMQPDPLLRSSPGDAYQRLLISYPSAGTMALPYAE